MRTIQAIFLLLISWCLQAQDVQFNASVTPNVLRIGEQFNLTYTTNQELSEIDVPELRDFELLGGPSQGHSQSVSSINGKITTTSTWQYTYFFRAVKEGKFTIPSASARIKNKTIRSNAVAVEVIKAKEPAQQNQSATGSNSNPQPNNISDKDLYVSLIPDKKEAYLGEPITVTIKIYTRVNLSGVDQNFKGPDFTGFFTEPVEVPELRSLQREAVNGEIYGTGVLRKVVIIPQKSGELVIQPFELGVTMQQEVRRRVADPFFEDFAIPEVHQIRVKLNSKPVRISVKPLPPNAPKTFQGAVGKFTLNASVNKTTTFTNDPLTLKLDITGKGNIKLISELNVNVPYDMEKYDPVINTKMDNALSGTKTFEYLIMPRVAGIYTLLPVEFTYFDPETRQYKTLRTSSYQITVEKGQGDTLMGAIPGMTKEDIRLLNQDIRFIKTKAFRLHRINVFLARSPVYYLLYMAALVVFALLIWNHKRLKRQRSDVTGVRLRRADAYARKRLRRSAGLLKQGNDMAFYEELLGAIWGYLSDKLKIPVAVLSKESAEKAMLDRGVDPGTIQRLFRVTEACEMARYARHSGELEMDKLYKEALETITGLQQKLK